MKFAKILEVLCILAWFVLTLLSNALLEAWALSKLWYWFVAAQYGEGPQLGVWFGIASIAGMLLHNEASEKLALKELKEDDPDYQSLWTASRKTLRGWAIRLITLGVTWCVGLMFHWVS